MKILGREPAEFIALLVALLYWAVNLGLPLNEVQTESTVAVLVAIGGLVTAGFVRSEKILPFVVGLAQAAVALAISFGLDWSTNTVVSFMTVVTLAVGLYVRDRVVAPVAESEVRVTR